MQKTANVSTRDAKLIEQMVKKCVRLLRKKEYELGLPTNAPDIAAKCLKVRCTPGMRSFAGRSAIKINIAYPGKVFQEYNSFAKDPCIGNRRCTDWEDIMWTLVAHEVSHHIQYRYCPWVSRFRKTYRKPHGDCFRQIYMYLRRDLVNPMIEEKLAAQVAA